MEGAPQGSRDDVLDTLVALRQPEHEVPDDIPLDLGRSGFDRVSAASQIPIGPLPVVESLCRPMIELTIGPLNLHRDLLESLVQLAPEDLLERPLRPRHARFLDSAESPELVQAHDFNCGITLR